MSAGGLPAGLSLNASTGAINGTPSASGAYSFTIRATDANSITATQAYSGAIASGLSITTAALPTPVLNAAYSQTISTSGGAAPVSFAVSAGSLPTGLLLNTSTGAITGTPTVAGGYGFTVRATDNNGVTATQAYSGAIAAELAAAADLGPAIIGQSYAGSLGVNGGRAPYSFSASGLPPGLTLNAGGAVTGTPTAAGSYSVTVQVTDANGVSATQTLTVVVTAAITASDQSVDVPYNTATTITLATLSAGDALELQSSPANGKLSQVGPIVEYTPNTGYIGADGFGFAIKGAWGQSRTASVKLNVLPPPPPTAEPPPPTTLDTTGPTGGGTGAAGDAAVVVDKVNFNLASLVKGVVTDVQIATQSKHGRVELIRTGALVAARATAERLCAAAAPAAPAVTAVYTADKGYVGRDSFTFVAIGPGGVSAPATVNIEVIKSTPTAPVLKVKALGGRKVTVDLTAAATDGPFLGAALVSTPAASIGAARLIEAARRPLAPMRWSSPRRAPTPARSPSPTR
ncbi:Ig domain-containing protein [Caulobacter segnis]|uniref:Ig domain-containing protein n=1 Tax=Caulobacter segnis TaxID=88688 RepID=UPI001CC00C2D|nr:Ig domain-containing protein [Caulobacter segnis]